MTSNITEDTTTTAVTTTTTEAATTTTATEEQVVFTTGGYSGNERLTSTEVYPQTSGCSIPSLPEARADHALFLTAGTNPLVAYCGGRDSIGSYSDSCVVWDSVHKRWDESMMSPLLQLRGWHSVVTIEYIGVYAMAGYGGTAGSSNSALTTSEFLPANSLQWTQGPSLPNGLGSYGCAVAISASSFLYIEGGVIREYEIDVDNPTSSGGWLEENRWPVLSYRRNQGCARIENSVLIAGGRGDGGSYLSSTKVLDIATRQVQIVGNLATPRGYFHLATVSTGGMTKTFALGGYDGSVRLSNVEEWNENDNNWKQAANLEEAKEEFAAVTVPLRLVCPVSDP